MHVFWCFKLLIYKEDKTSEIYIFRLTAGSARVSGSDPLSSGILLPFVALPTDMLGLELQVFTGREWGRECGWLILTRSLEWFMSFSSLLLFDRKRKRKCLFLLIRDPYLVAYLFKTHSPQYSCFSAHWLRHMHTLSTDPASSLAIMLVLFCLLCQISWGGSNSWSLHNLSTLFIIKFSIPSSAWISLKIHQGPCFVQWFQFP